MDKKQFIIIGLGVFGSTVARELSKVGHDVLGIDLDGEKVSQIADEITCAVTADASLESTLNELNAGNYDVAVIATGSNLETSVLATMQLREMGVEEVWAKARTYPHHKILQRVGATRIIAPEYETGIRVSRELIYPMVQNYIDLKDDLFVVELLPSEDLCTRSLKDVIGKLAITPLILKRGSNANTHPSLDECLQSGDCLVVSGKIDDLRKLAASV
ncbi:MAG: TrkA family potassium uptake protein [Oleibacter sp.]|nr:TrkA family potassium uptake protein [Thalassolituus sp.]